jgi:hypothetical protein
MHLDKIIGYYVNPDKKEIGEKINSGGMESVQGILTGFFNWKKN